MDLSLLKSYIITGNVKALDAILQTYTGNLNYPFNGQTLLEIIIGSTHEKKYDMMHMLLNKGANINQQNFKGMTPIMHAIITNDLKLIKNCLLHKPNLSLVDNYFYTPLMYAVTNYHSNQYQIVKLLLDAGANPNQIGPMGISALHFAVNTMNRRSSLKIVKLLINRGANVHCLTNNDYDILMLTIASMDEYDIISQPFHLDVPFRTSGDSLNFIDDLLKNGFDINHTNVYGTTPLMLAVKLYTDNALTLVKLLLEHGADVNRVDHDGFTSLMWAAKNSRTKLPILELLISYGADVNAYTYTHMNFLDFLPPSHFKICQKYAHQINQRKELNNKLCGEIISQVPHILYRPGSIRAQLLALKWDLDSIRWDLLKIKNAFLILYFGISDDDILRFKISDYLRYLD